MKRELGGQGREEVGLEGRRERLHAGKEADIHLVAYQ